MLESSAMDIDEPEKQEIQGPSEGVDDSGIRKTQTVAYVASQQLAQVSSLLPSNRNRSMVVHALVSACGMFSPDYSPVRAIRVLKPAPADRRALCHYHTREYVDYVLAPQNHQESVQTREFGLEDDCPPFKGLHEYVPLVAGASLTAAKALKDKECEIAIAWDGGRHHAQKSHASGYCYVADCVLAILALKRPDAASAGSKPKVMYLDLDLHFSDAVSQAFHCPSQTSSQVLTLSIHHSAPGFYPVSPLSGLPDPNSIEFDPYTLSLPLSAGASNSTYARIWPLIERIHNTFKPDYIVVQCGLDGLAGDPCTTFNWSLGGGEGSLGWCLQTIIERWSGKKLLLGGGGYNTPNAARAWAYLTSIALGKPLNLEDDIPDHKAFSLYAPSYTFDLPRGNMTDQNSDEYLTLVEDCYRQVIAHL